MNNIKILLISINKIKRSSNSGIDLLAGFIRSKGYDVDILYFHSSKRHQPQIILKEIPTHYNLYGFSVDSSNIELCSKISRQLKLKCPESYIVYGGAFPSLYYREILKEYSDFDAIILGDGEAPLLRYIKNIANKEVLPHKSIVTHTDNQYKELNYNKEINYLPVFDYYNVKPKSNNKFKYHCIQSKNNICTGSCSFCNERKGKVSYKNINLIFDEITHVSNQYGVKKFFFTDDNLFDPNDYFAKIRILELCKKLLNQNINCVYECYIRADTFSDTIFDNELLAIMRKTGFVSMFVGLESGNNNDLELYNKHTTVQMNYQIIELLKKHDILPVIGFINFNPYSTPESLKSNFNFLLNIKAANIFHYACTFLDMHKYTPLYKKAESDGLIIDDTRYKDRFNYLYINDIVGKMAEFLRKNMYSEIQSLQFEADWLYQTYLEYAYLEPKIKFLESSILECKENTLKLIAEFFSKLFIDNDICSCVTDVTSFISTINEYQKDYLEIYNKMIKIIEDS